MNLYKRISDWLIANYSPLNNWIYFNATPVDVGTVAMNSVAGESVIKEFVTGRKLKRLTFAVDMITNYDALTTSSINLEAMDEVLNFQNWIIEQHQAKNYPLLEDKMYVDKIDVLNNIPTLLIDAQQHLAKYQFQVSVDYYDESEEI